MNLNSIYFNQWEIQRLFQYFWALGLVVRYMSPPPRIHTPDFAGVASCSVSSSVVLFLTPHCPTLDTITMSSFPTCSPLKNYVEQILLKIRG